MYRRFARRSLLTIAAVVALGSTSQEATALAVTLASFGTGRVGTRQLSVHG
jgi:hypothetical protein